MLLATFLNILGACVGFMSAVFFSVGAMTLTPTGIHRMSITMLSANQDFVDSLVDQQADYIVGGLLLLLSFLSQLSANLVSPTVELSLLQPSSCATALVVSTLAFLLVVAVVARYAIARFTRQRVRQLQATELALAAKNKLGVKS